MPGVQKSSFNWQEERALKILVPKYYGTGMCYLGIKLQVFGSTDNNVARCYIISMHFANLKLKERCQVTLHNPKVQ